MSGMVHVGDRIATVREKCLENEFFPGQGKVREFVDGQGNFRKDLESQRKVREFAIWLWQAVFRKFIFLFCSRGERMCILMR